MTVYSFRPYIFKRQIIDIYKFVECCLCCKYTTIELSLFTTIQYPICNDGLSYILHTYRMQTYIILNRFKWKQEHMGHTTFNNLQNHWKGNRYQIDTKGKGLPLFFFFFFSVFSHLENRSLHLSHNLIQQFNMTPGASLLPKDDVY